MAELVYAVLAAGRSQRMGFPKAIAPLAGASPLARLARILDGRSTVVVTLRDLAAAAARAFPAATICVNEAPDGGMTSSLHVVERLLRPGATLGILLADKPFVTAETLDRCERALSRGPRSDVLIAAVDGELGHPVYFRGAARARLRGAPCGDTLRSVRDDATLGRIVLGCSDPGVLTDLDDPPAWQAAEARLAAAAGPSAAGSPRA